MSNLFDDIITASDQTERPAYRQIPPGRYRAIVREAKEVTANTGNKGIEMVFTVLEPVEPIDLEGSDPAKARLRDTIWITEGTVNSKYPPKDKLAAITAEAVGLSYRDAIQVLPGNEVIVNLKHGYTDRNGEPLRTPRLDVVSYVSAEQWDARRAA